MNKYDEIMDKIEVDDEMRKRILAYVKEVNLRGRGTAGNEKKTKLVRLKKQTVRSFTAAAACIVLLFVCLFAWPRISKINRDDSGPSVSITNGIEEVNSAEELAAAVNFPVNELTGLPFRIEKEVYTSYWGELAQIEYIGETQTAVFRKGRGTDDVSGDYNEYPQVLETKAGAYPVTLKGEKDRFTLAIWTDGEYSYALALEEGMDESGWITLIGQCE